MEKESNETMKAALTWLLKGAIVLQMLDFVSTGLALTHFGLQEMNPNVQRILDDHGWHGFFVHKALFCAWLWWMPDALRTLPGWTPWVTRWFNTGWGAMLAATNLLMFVVVMGNFSGILAACKGCWPT